MEGKNVVPFGKYKGQPVEVLRGDTAYCDWLTAQDWFRERYSGLWTVIINNFAEPSETPEHNRLQARFLDQQLCRNLLVAAQCPLITSNGEDITAKPTVKIRTDFEVHGWDVHIHAAVDGDGYSERNAYVEIKTSLGDDYPATLRQMKANWHRIHGASGRVRVLVVDQFTAAGATIDQVRTIFRSSKFTVLSISEISGNMP